jgi:alpha-tubulin suppressor-like RCC1 family protein
VVALLALVTGCGRLDFGEDSLPVDASHDAGSGCTIEAVTAGAYDSCALTSDHALYCWGDNSHGALGVGDFDNRLVPTRVPLDGVLQVSAGVEQTTCAVLADHTVWCFGGDESNELTDGLIADRATPVQIQDAAGAFGDVVEVIVGEHHACARRSNGALWCWGSDAFGQLGDQIAQQYVPYPVKAQEDVVDALASYAQTCAWMGAQRVLQCWGDNDAGQLGDGTTNTPVLIPEPIAIDSVIGGASAYQSMCVLLADGRVECTGVNDVGNLGTGTNMPSETLTEVLVAAGGAAFDHAVEVGVGDSGACARRDDGTVWCWGGNADGQVGNGTNSSTFNPVQVGLATAAIHLGVGNTHTCAALADGHHVQCWGNNSAGGLGNNSMANSSIPVDVAPICP